MGATPPLLPPSHLDQDRDAVPPMKTPEYLIIHPNKITLLDLLSLLFLRKTLNSCKFVESSSTVAETLGDSPINWLVQLSLFLQWVLVKVKTPLAKIGQIIEFTLNFLAVNGGVFGLLWRALTCSIKIPKEGTKEYRTFLGYIDDRVELHKDTRSSSLFPLMGKKVDGALGDLNRLDLTMMASKIAYENEAFITDVVNNHWKMNFVTFVNGWNVFANANTTQAFVFTDKPSAAELIVVAFRGTEPFNADDWSTDVDLGFLTTLKMGKVHVGFMKALGLQNALVDISIGFPSIFIPNPLNPNARPAYYTIRDTLNKLIKANPNAKIVITGHSLGAALAAVFPSVLALHSQDAILNKIDQVVTHAQPRVGDSAFGKYVTGIRGLNYERVVYRYDLVPRVPFDIPLVSDFKHFGTCLYYDGWYVSKDVDEVPNKNYFDIKYLVPMHLKALQDLVKGTLLGKTEGSEYKESIVTFLFRLVGLVIPGVASHSPRDYVNGARLSRFVAATDFKDIV